MAVIRIKEIHDSDHAALATRAVAETIDRLGKRAFTKQELLHLIAKHREEWHILDRVPPKRIIDYLLSVFSLRKIVLNALITHRNSIDTCGAKPTLLKWPLLC